MVQEKWKHALDWESGGATARDERDPEGGAIVRAEACLPVRSREWIEGTGKPSRTRRKGAAPAAAIEASARGRSQIGSAEIGLELQAAVGRAQGFR